MRFQWPIVRRIAPADKPYPPGGCLRCGRRWRRRAVPHMTHYTTPEATFPLCEACWQALTPAGRLPYYRRLWETWIVEAEEPSHHDYLLDVWPLIETAVEAGR